MRAAGRYTSIACKVYVRKPAPQGDAVDLRGGGYGLRAVRIFRSSFPGEWILYEYDGSGQTKVVCIGSEPVSIVFGPHI